MSNFGLSVDEGFEKELRSRPDRVFGRHAGWNFNGRVWFDGTTFHEEVWTWGIPVEIISADTLEGLMAEVNSKYGSE